MKNAPQYYYFKTLIYYNKKFYLMNKTENAFNHSILKYFCINNNTTIDIGGLLKCCKK